MQYFNGCTQGINLDPSAIDYKRVSEYRFACIRGITKKNRRTMVFAVCAMGGSEWSDAVR